MGPKPGGIDMPAMAAGWTDAILDSGWKRSSRRGRLVCCGPIGQMIAGPQMQGGQRLARCAQSNVQRDERFWTGEAQVESALAGDRGVVLLRVDELATTAVLGDNKGLEDVDGLLLGRGRW